MLVCIAADSVVDLAQIFQAYQAAFNNPAFYTTTTEPAVASTYLKEVMFGHHIACLPDVVSEALFSHQLCP